MDRIPKRYRPAKANANMSDTQAGHTPKIRKRLDADYLLSRIMRTGDKVRNRKNINYYVFGDEHGAKS